MAFGRNKDDVNPFGEARPAGAAAPVSDEHRQIVSVARGDRLFLLLFIVLTVVGTYLLLHHAEDKAVNDPVQKAARGEVTGATGLSLIRQANFRRALGAVQAKLKPDEVVTNLRLDPGALNVTARDTEGDQRYFGVDLAYKVHISSSGTTSGDGELGLRNVDASAPERFLAAILDRTHFDPKKLEYMVYDPAEEGDPSDWSAYFEDVPIKQKTWYANGKGRYARLSGEPDPDQEARSAAEYARSPVGSTDPQYAHYSATKDGETHSYEGPQALAVIRCVRAAGQDTETILGCLK